MNVLVLGGNGFIGSHIVDRLLLEGHMVRVLSHSPEKYRKPIPEVEYHISSFENTTSLVKALEGIDIVYHLISTTLPSTSNQDLVFDIESNLITTVQLLNLMKNSGVSRIVFLSSGGTVYGVPEMSPIPETHPKNPICSYGVVKLAIENYLQMFQSLYDIDALILRVSNPYGEHQGFSSFQGVIGTFLRKVMEQETVEIWGDGSVVRDFIYIKDLADFCVKAGTSNKTGIYNIGSGLGYSINDIVSSISKITGVSIAPVYKSSRSYDVPISILDVSKAYEAFNWKAETSLNTGINQTWDWLLSKPYENLKQK